MDARAVVVTRHGGPEVLAVESRPVPEPGPGQLLVEVAGSGGNFIDVYKREGVYATEPPFVLGEECAGRVLAVGPDVAEIAVGDVVATSAGAYGTHATHTLVDAATAVPVPAGLDPELAAAAMLQGMTAHYLVNSTFPVQAGQDVLVHAAAGGVGQLLVQLCVATGALVIATAGSAEKVAIARELGAAEAIRYDEADDLAAAVHAAAPDGVHVAFDGV